jgi:hypothetical protein
MGKYLRHYTDDIKEAIKYKRIYGGSIIKYREISDKELSEIEKNFLNKES